MAGLKKRFICNCAREEASSKLHPVAAYFASSLFIPYRGLIGLIFRTHKLSTSKSIILRPRLLAYRDDVLTKNGVLRCLHHPLYCLTFTSQDRSGADYTVLTGFWGLPCSPVLVLMYSRIYSPFPVSLSLSVIHPVASISTGPSFHNG
jgi:hypothetical protein